MTDVILDLNCMILEKLLSSGFSFPFENERIPAILPLGLKRNTWALRGMLNGKPSWGGLPEVRFETSLANMLKSVSSKIQKLAGCDGTHL